MRRCLPGLLVLVLAVLWPFRFAHAAQEYVVRQGDTLWHIAHLLRVTPESLASANHLSLDSTIHPGLRLTVPERPAPAASPGQEPSTTAFPGQEYVVRQGDTLWRIAHLLGVSPENLASANHFSLDATIRAGLRLKVPGAPVSARPSTPRSQPAAERPSGVASGDEVNPARTALPSRGVGFSSAVVRSAMGYLGRSYQWAGDGPRGFDCSGLVWRVFAGLGLDLPRSSFDQYEAGVPVPATALLPGDLVFFHTYNSGPSHVGIYVGDGRFVHSASDRGVILSSLDEPYYRSRYIGARRL